MTSNAEVTIFLVRFISGEIFMYINNILIIHRRVKLKFHDQYYKRHHRQVFRGKLCFQLKRSILFLRFSDLENI